MSDLILPGVGRRTLLLGAGAAALGSTVAGALAAPASALTGSQISQNLFGLWYKPSLSAPLTAEVIRAFQRDNNLIADGDPGPITQTHLVIVSQRVQGVVGVTADGLYGPATTSAVKAWQLDHLGYGQGQAGPATMHGMRIQRDLSKSAEAAQLSVDEIVSRGRTWTDQRLPYSMTTTAPDAQGKHYRTDCSGFVAMAWHLSWSPNTVTLVDYVTPVTEKSSIRKGDCIGTLGEGTGGANGHVVLFEKWADNSHTSYVGLEESGSKGAIRREIPYPYFGTDTRYKPYRYGQSMAADY